MLQTFVDKVKKQLLHVLFSFTTQVGAHGGCSLLLQAPVFERKREGEKGPKNSVQESKQNPSKRKKRRLALTLLKHDFHFPYTLACPANSLHKLIFFFDLLDGV